VGTVPNLGTGPNHDGKWGLSHKTAAVAIPVQAAAAVVVDQTRLRSIDCLLSCRLKAC
jgi:hypothetical protein